MPLPARPTLLITGARGNLASRAIPALRDAFHLRLTDLGPPAGDEDYLQADLTQFGQVQSIMSDVDVVLHCAMVSDSEVPPTFNDDELSPDDQAIMAVNLHGTYHVYEAARRAGVRKIVYLSSLTSHLGNKERSRYDGNTPVDPTNLYACTKIFGENLGRVYSRQYGIAIICLRIGQPYPLLARLDDKWKESKRVRSWFVTLEDVNRAISCGLNSDVPFGIYHIVSGSDNQRIDLSEAREIGYVPRGYFSDDGLAFYDEGTMPVSSAPIVTHAS